MILQKVALLVCTGLFVVRAGLAETPPLQPGLIATATDGQRTVTFVMPTANFNLTAQQSIHPQITPAFKVTWSGFLNVIRSGTYTITGDVRVFVDGNEIQGRPTKLETGDRAVRIEYQRKPGPARLQLWWRADFFKPEPIPSNVFGHREAPAECEASARLWRGRRLVEKHNCIGCHKADAPLTQGRRGPDLTSVGARVKPSWIYQWLADPKHFSENAVMPVLLADEKDRADVTAYLATLTATKRPIDMPKKGSSATGKRLVNSIGCTACHTDKNLVLKGLGSKFAPLALAQYLRDPLAIDPSGRMPDLAVTKDEAPAIAEFLMESKNKEFEKPAPKGDAVRGKTLVANSGCLNCHTIREGAGKAKSTLAAPAFAKLHAGRGCLAEAPTGKAPRFSLTSDDRASLTVFIESPDRNESPVQDFYRVTEQFHCINCHSLNGPPKVEFDQAPPPLTYAGEKLRASWLDLVLNQRKRVRPWLALRMPHFGESNTRRFIDLFAAQSGATFGEGETIPKPAMEQVKSGIKLIGADGGLSCITCHDFRGERSIGEKRGPDMTEMYARCRTDWMRRWLRDPVRILPGTAMPQFFTEMPEAQSAPMIERLTHALWAGKNMPMPAGMREEATAYLLRVRDEPIVMRTFITDASNHAIVVGLPGQISYCFDATPCGLHYAWTGDFLDMKAAWKDRGGGVVSILGPKFYTASGCSLRIGSPESMPKVQFHGYRLINKLPEFMYDVNGIAVRERITALPKMGGLVDAFELGATDKDVWFVSGASDGAIIKCSAGQMMNGRVKIPAGTVRFEVTIQVK